jgi:hypothetical protein
VLQVFTKSPQIGSVWAPAVWFVTRKTPTIAARTEGKNGEDKDLMFPHSSINGLGINGLGIKKIGEVSDARSKRKHNNSSSREESNELPKGIEALEAAETVGVVRIRETH